MDAAVLDTVAEASDRQLHMSVCMWSVRGMPALTGRVQVCCPWVTEPQCGYSIPVWCSGMCL